MHIVGMLAMTVLTVLIALIVIMVFPWLRRLAGFGGLAPTGIAGSVANAVNG